MEEIEMRRPDTEEAAFLALSEGQHVLSVLRVAHSTDGTPVEATVNVFAGDQWRLTYEWDIEPSHE